MTREAHVPDRSLAVAVNVIAAEIERQQATLDAPDSPDWARVASQYEIYGMRRSLAALGAIIEMYAGTRVPAVSDIPAERLAAWAKLVLAES